MPEQLPQWNAVGVEPPQSLKDSGWQPGTKPAAQHMNWLLNRAYKCIEELQQTGGNVDDLTQAVADLERTVDSKFMEIDGDIADVDIALNNHRKDVTNHVYYAIESGGDANGKTAKINADIIAYQSGLCVTFYSTGGANANGNVSLNVNNMGLKHIVKPDGSAHWYAGEFPINQYVTVRQLPNNGSFQLQGESGVTDVANGSKEFTVPGTYSFTLPAGVSRITYYMWGGGGGGGYTDSTNYGAGAGGAGGMAYGNLYVKPYEKLTLFVGSGGNGSNSSGVTAATGGNSYIYNEGRSIEIYAYGGGAGGNGSSSTGGKGGMGGGEKSSGWSAQVLGNAKDGMTVKRGNSYPSDNKHEIYYIIGADGSGYDGGGAGAAGAGGSGDYGGGKFSKAWYEGGAGGIGFTYPGKPGGIGGASSNKATDGVFGSGGGGGGNKEGYLGGGKGGDGRIILIW
ncbi:glycine-rich domain-containing protein [Lysinibacillus xylanilyticus]|uniref:glycine-rich domain-containing protein n=1 Tax=Lysinibacillus xylanilyticus TaxID=582475 RepID=UPI0037F9AF10